MGLKLIHPGLSLSQDFLLCKLCSNTYIGKKMLVHSKNIELTKIGQEIVKMMQLVFPEVLSRVDQSTPK